MPTISKISPKPKWPGLNRPCHKGYLFVQAIPSTTKRRFKHACAIEPKETMRDAIIRLMRFYVAHGKEFDAPVPKPLQFNALIESKKCRNSRSLS